MSRQPQELVLTFDLIFTFEYTGLVGQGDPRNFIYLLFWFCSPSVYKNSGVNDTVMYYLAFMWVLGTSHLHGKHVYPLINLSSPLRACGRHSSKHGSGRGSRLRSTGEEHADCGSASEAGGPLGPVWPSHAPVVDPTLVLWK